MKHNWIVPTLGLIGLAVLILMLVLTSPTEIGPVGVLVFFTAIYVVSFALATILWGAYKRLALKQKTLKKKDYLYAVVAAFCPIMLLMVCSFGALNLLTISLTIVFVVLTEFLVYKKA